MTALPTLLHQLNAGKHFPYRNATPRSSVSLGLLYDLGVIGAGKVPANGDTSALEARLTVLEKKVVDLQTELDNFTAGTNYKIDQVALASIDQQKQIEQGKTDLALHVNNGEHWTGEQIDDRVNAIVSP